MTAEDAIPAETRASWIPMVGLFLAQVLMSFNVAALPVSLGGIVEEFDVAATVASTSIVVYGLVVAALVMVGAKLGQRVGQVYLFRVVVAVFAQCFFVWTRRREEAGEVPLVSLTVLGSPSERAAVYAMFVVVVLEGALNFTVPVYIQIVQGRTPFDTAIAMMPFNLTVFVTATLVVRFYGRFTSRPSASPASA